jgi:large subunit ribosomal protein L9
MRARSHLPAELAMRLILLKDVDKIGKKFEVKEVKDGYARNFLIPKDLGKPATAEALKWLEIQKEIEAKRAEDDLGKMQTVASAIDDQEIVFTVKVGDENQLFESITAQKIVEKLKEAGFEIKKSQVNLEQPIKELGEFPVKIKFEHNLEAEIRIIVAKEEGSGEGEEE